MISKTRSFRGPRNPIGMLILLATFAAAAGCSTANTPGDVVVNHVNASGNSVPGWLTPTGGLHANSATMNYIANGGSSSCTECHGSDLAGGISRVSCFNAACHHDPIAGWVAVSPAAQNHGVSAKNAPGSSGFASCRICHGSDFAGTTSAPSCFNNAACHGAGVVSPHPSKWRISTGGAYNHDSTNAANAPECYSCHAYTGTANPNNPTIPTSPASAGTAPGCFNGTMCHNQAVHPTGWVATRPAAQPHGDTAKKDGTVAGQGFPSCQTCHGNNFAGTTVGPTCLNNAACHGAGVASPHAAKPWRASAGSTYTHTTAVETGNAAVCASCHFEGSPNNPAGHPATPAPAGTPAGCFNNTLCHGPSGAPHLVPYNDESHYTVTSATFPGSCSACHDVSAPTVKSGPACRTCHIAESPLTALNCTSCHAGPPDGGPPAGAAYPNIPGAHATHIFLNGAGTCNTCHTGLGSRTIEHYNRAKSPAAPGDVAFAGTYNAESGTSAFDNSAALSCSNVSCHGGQATPNWQTGALDVNTQCASCHALGTSQFNSYVSGRHDQSAHRLFPCTVCHNTATLAVNHFTALGTPAMEGPASATIGGTGTLVTTYDPATQSCSPQAGVCHVTRTW